MPNNSFRGFGAIPQSDSWLANEPGITPLGKQYTDSLNGYWQSANTYGGFALVTTGGQPAANYWVQIFKKRGLTNRFDKLLNPIDMPAVVPKGVACSPNGKFLVIPLASSPYIYIYKREVETFTKLSNPGSLPTGAGNGVAFSPDGKYLAVAHATTPFVTIYKINGDTFTKISSPFNTLPTAAGLCVAWSPDGNYLAAGMGTTPFVNVWKINSSTDTFTKLTIPTAPIPGYSAQTVAFSPDSLHLIYAGGNTPSYGGYLIDSSTDTFTELTILGNPANVGQHVAFSPDGVYMSIGTATSFGILKRNNANNTYSLIASQPPAASNPAGEVNASSWSADGNYLLVSGANEPIILYTRTGDTFARAAANTIQDSSFSITAASGVQSGVVWFNAP
jgi:WD40 repeat protein